MNEPGRRKGLGRGLAALIDDTRPDALAAPDTVAAIDRLRPNPDQPRKHFDEAELEALAASIREKGIIQPLIVRPDPRERGSWEIVAGERRWRAAQHAGIHEVPIIVRHLDDAEALELAILENVQRADLNPIEEAAGYAQLIERFGHTQERLAASMGKSRSYIANALRLLSLPAEVQALARAGSISAGHARTLVGANNALEIAKTVIARKLSVRDTEKLVKTEGDRHAARARPPAQVDPDTQALEADLTAALGLKISIRHGAGEGGELRITYRNLDELDALCRLITK
jgi:ParB family chromosome partitioning protein